MSVSLLGYLFVIAIPLAEGVLLALVLREVYIRHPLPLGGVIVHKWWKQAQPTIIPAKPAAKEEKVASDNSKILTPKDVTTETPTAELPPSKSEMEPTKQLHSEISVFDGTPSIPQNLSVGNVLDAMTSETPAASLHDFERVIDESALSDATISEKIHRLPQNIILADAEVPGEALQKKKIDFSQELDTDSNASHDVTSIAKEVLGENFDIDALERQSKKMNEALSLQAHDPVKTALVIQDDRAGSVQVSSPCITNLMPQLADFAMPQTVLSTFSNDWVQELNGMPESNDEDAKKFCFTEESRPMFVRKK